MRKRLIAAVAGILIVASIVAFGIVFAISEVTEAYECGAAATGLESGEIATLAGISPGDNIFASTKRRQSKR